MAQARPAVSRQQGVAIRPAREADVAAIVALVNRLAETDVMLPRSPESVRAALEHFLVAEREGAFVGCAALKLWSKDLAEVRSLVVDEAMRMHGVGRLLVEALVVDAQRRGVAQLFAFTLVPGFFHKLGFEVVQHETLPHKVFYDCLFCPKMQSCDEIAMVRVLRADAPPIAPAELLDKRRIPLKRRRKDAAAKPEPQTPAVPATPPARAFARNR